jgi:predicted thioesterase
MTNLIKGPQLNKGHHNKQEPIGQTIVINIARVIPLEGKKNYIRINIIHIFKK